MNQVYLVIENIDLGYHVKYCFQDKVQALAEVDHLNKEFESEHGRPCKLYEVISVSVL